MGVELGKRLAKQVKPLLRGTLEQQKKSVDEFDPSTLDLVNRINNV